MTTQHAPGASAIHMGSIREDDAVGYFVRGCHYEGTATGKFRWSEYHGCAEVLVRNSESGGYFYLRASQLVSHKPYFVEPCTCAQCVMIAGLR